MNFSKKAISLAGILLIVVQSLPAQVRQTREEYIDRYKSIDAWNHDPIFGQDGFEKLMDVMALAGQLDQRADYATIVNTQFAEKAVQLEQ